MNIFIARDGTVCKDAKEVEEHNKKMKIRLLPDIRIRKVKVLKGRVKEEAEKKGLKPDDLVIIITNYNVDSLPEYHIEKIDGDPISYLLKRIKTKDNT